MRKSAWSMILATVLAQSANAAIVYRQNGGPPAALPAGNIINLGSLAQNTTIHIYDDTGVDESVGLVTIRGSANGHKLMVQVINEADADGFDGEPQDPIVVGLRNLGGLLIQGPLGPTDPDTSLRDMTIVSISVQGDITGPIDVAQVWRIDAFQSADGTFGGTIAGNITAHRENNRVLGGGAEPTRQSISYIRAGRGITGTITALSPTFQLSSRSPVADILRIVAGPAAPAGLQGDIFAEQGRIGSIFTTGDIGTLGVAPVRIYAGDGIRQIRAVNEANQTTVLSKNFHADIRSHRLIEQNREEFPYNRPAADGVLQLVETAGDVTGTIRAANIACCDLCPEGTINPLVPGPNPGASCSRLGIFAQGEISGPIVVDYFVLLGNIIAGRFTEDITIGRFIKGCVVATGRESPQLQGRIESLVVGRGPLPPGELFAYFAYGPGLCGINGDPYATASNSAAWYAQGVLGQDGGALDGAVLAAESTGFLDLASVTLNFGGQPKNSEPRLESPVIGTLSIDDFDVGVVWSGRLNRSDDFALITHVSIGCMGKQTAIWFRDWTSARVERNMFGDIHAPRVPPGSKLQIGRHFGDLELPMFMSGGRFESALCECMVWPEAFCAFHGLPPEYVNEDTPRRDDYPTYLCSLPRPNRGRIWLRQADGLQGPIVINASGETVPNGAGDPYGDVALLMTGALELGGNYDSPPCSASTIADDSFQLDLRAPYYTRASGPMGGSAVGVVPYHHYPTDSNPVPTAEGVAVSQARISGIYQVPLTPLDVRTYGHLVPSADVGVVEKLVNGQWDGSGTWMFRRVAAPEGFPRSIHIATRAVGYPAQNIPVPLGRYRFRQGADTPNPVRCAETFLALPPLVADFTYEFCVVRDCPPLGGTQADGVPDFDTCTFTPCPNTGCTHPICDCDDGSFTGTPDGGVTVDDLLYFLFLFDTGNPGADIDDGTQTATPDGGVTIDDLLFFLLRFDMGC